MTLLITPTLLDSFDFAKSCPPSWKDRALLSLLAKLKREPFKMNEAAKKGIEFEKAVYAACKEYTEDTNNFGKYENYSEEFKEVVRKSKGGATQKVFKEIINHNEQDYLIYCKLDLWFPEHIIDIKTTANYRGASKYVSGWQSKLYPLTTGITSMSYLVAEWENKDSRQVKRIYEVNIYDIDLEEARTKLLTQIDCLLTFLYDRGIYEDFYFTFSNNRR